MLAGTSANNATKQSDGQMASDPSMGTFLIALPWEPVARGGVNQVVLNLCEEIRQTGPFIPLILVIDWSALRLQEYEMEGFRTACIRLRAPRAGSAFLRSFFTYTLTFPSSLYRWWRLILRYDVRVVNGHFPSLQMMNVALLRLFGLYRGSLLLSFHGTDAVTVLAARGMERVLWRWLFRHADATIVCSEAIGDRLKSFYSSLKVVTVRNGISPERLRAEKNSVPDNRSPGERPFILNIGAFLHLKGQDILIRAFARIAPDFPELDLVIVGNRGPAQVELQSLVTALELQGRVRFHVDVPHPEVLAFLEKARVFAFPSRSEGLPIAVLEAGFLGIPVVASRVGGIPEIINSAKVGILVEADDDRALELALRRLLRDADQRALLGKCLQQRVIAEFTWNRAW